MRGRARQLAIGSLFLACALSIAGQEQPEPDMRTVMAHVMLFQMNDETGVVEPKSWHQVEWPGLRYETEDALTAALAQDDNQRKHARSGKLAIRARDKKGKVVFRSVISVPLWNVYPIVDGKGNVVREAWERVKKPAFTIVVPDGTKDFSVEGWLPATKASFSIGVIAARFAQSTNH